MSDTQAIIDQVSEAQMNLDDKAMHAALIAAQAELERLQTIVGGINACDMTLYTEGRKCIAIADDEAGAKQFYHALRAAKLSAENAREQT